MNRLKSLLTLLVLANWFACTAHCQSEKSRLIQNPDGRSSVSLQTASPRGGSENCHICDWVASGGYENAASRIVLPESVTPTPSDFLKAVLDAQLRAQESDGQTEWSTAPPDLTPTVHFASRAALPARAPSIAS